MVVDVGNEAAPIVTISDIEACLGTTGVTFNPSITPAGTYDYTWEPDDGSLSDIYIENPEIYVSEIGNKTYTLDVIDPSTGCRAIAQSTVSTASCTFIVPDFSPTIYSSNLHTMGTSAVVDMTLLIGEYNNIDSKIPQAIIVKVNKDPRYVLSFNTGLTAMNGQTVNNADWLYDGTDPAQHIFTYQGNANLFLRDTKSLIGLSATLDPDAGTRGTYAVDVEIIDFSGGEVETTNNADVEYLNFFND